MEASDGESASVKSANCTDRGSVAVIVPEVVVLELDVVATVLASWLVVATVPVTVKLSDEEVMALRFPTVSVLDCPGVIDAGLKAQVAGPISPQLRTIGPVNPSLVEADTANFTWSVPTSTVAELGSAVSVKGGTPVPVSVMVCGESRAVSVIVSVPTLVPRADGEKLTAMEQLLAGFTTFPQVFDSE